MIWLYRAPIWGRRGVLYIIQMISTCLHHLYRTGGGVSTLWLFPWWWHDKHLILSVGQTLSQSSHIIILFQYFHCGIFCRNLSFSFFEIDGWTLDKWFFPTKFYFLIIALLSENVLVCTGGVSHALYMSLLISKLFCTKKCFESPRFSAVYFFSRKSCCTKNFLILCVTNTPRISRLWS